MSHLAVQVQDYLAQPGITATALEHKAGLKRGALDSIQREQHPRPERLGQIIRALEYLARLEIIIRQLETSSSLQESPTAYTVTTPEHGPLAVLAAWQRLQDAIQSDTTLARWFIKTVTLILGPV